jgi:uncharacterized Rossmann fold enzyme/2-polyprenyl-3-methyl-5-hydroxy-6-metoxy-1,4-benzoquinol methylase
MLDPSKKQGVTYCIPTWLRDEQVKLNTANVKGRIQPRDRTEEPVAVVCFGPSLNQTWEEVKNFKNVISCSGSHKYLVEKGIIPNWHVEVDPRPHKIQLIGQPQKETEYLIASACHPDVFKHLQDYNVKLWHVFDPSEDGARLLPRGEWAITGGCDVGLRAMVIASFLGFRSIHVFGMDHSAGTEDNPLTQHGRHAAEHPNGKHKLQVCEYEGVKYLTTPGMLEAARMVKHELEQMPIVDVTFHGEGLCQAMAKKYEKKKIPEHLEANIVAISKPELISSDYVELNEKLHQDNLAYGVGGGKHADTVLKLCERLKTTSVLDYGCGKGYLGKALPFPIWEYDPAIEGKKDSPRPADIVVCTDVLEHIEPDKIMFVIEDLHRCMKKVGFFTIHTGPAKKFLADGRNAHLIQEDRAWWTERLSKFFEIGRVYEVGVELWFVVSPKVGVKLVESV